MKHNKIVTSSVFEVRKNVQFILSEVKVRSRTIYFAVLDTFQLHSIALKHSN
jgi:hypothetical protein